MEDRMSAHGALAVMHNSQSSILYSLSPSLRHSHLCGSILSLRKSEEPSAMGHPPSIILLPVILANGLGLRLYPNAPIGRPDLRCQARGKTERQPQTLYQTLDIGSISQPVFG